MWKKIPIYEKKDPRRILEAAERNELALNHRIDVAEEGRRLTTSSHRSEGAALSSKARCGSDSANTYHGAAST